MLEKFLLQFLIVKIHIIFICFQLISAQTKTYPRFGLSHKPTKKSSAHKTAIS